MSARFCLVSTPGPICDATCATISMMPNVRLVALAPRALSATQLIYHVQLDFILLDSNLLEGEVSALLTWLADHASSVCKVVARTTSAECNQALSFGANEAIRRDELAPKLSTLIAEIFGSGYDINNHLHLLNKSGSDSMYHNEA